MYKKIIITIVFILITLFLIVLSYKAFSSNGETPETLWEVQAIDTMKFSRDTAYEKLEDSSFDVVIERQVKDISDTGATHVSIATPYDERFNPFLERWVEAARKHGLNVWFRGNWAGWEEWFGYPEITREEHIEKTEEFILNNKTLFRDGDIFTACPECENGGPGDPRQNGDLSGHREFLIDEHRVVEATFNSIGKDVITNFNSMNGDVAKLVMDKKTTDALGGIVTIDHYVETPEKLIKDINEIKARSGGKIVLGEFGAPIPDIHGDLNEEEQAKWVRDSFISLVKDKDVIGVNYWTNTGSSTQIWEENGDAREVFSVIEEFYNPEIIRVSINDEAGSRLRDTELTFDGAEIEVNEDGNYYLPFIEGLTQIEVKREGYVDSVASLTNDNNQKIILVKLNEDMIFKIRKLINSILPL